MNATRQVIREAIQQLLREHVNEPFLLLREAGLQAQLWSILRQRFSPSVVIAQIDRKDIRSKHRHTGDFKTSRIQLEVKVGDSRETSDIVVLVDRKPRLTCWPDGPTDVVAVIEPGDIEAVIEMKASPSRSAGQRIRYDNDLKKLVGVRKEDPQIQCYFILIDKSLSVPGATCDPSLAAEWPVPAILKVHEDGSDNDDNLIEIWDLDCGAIPSPRLRYLA